MLGRLAMARNEINLGDFVVNKASVPYLIAEIGINHNGDIQIAKRLMDLAFACGWNAVKFQKRVPDIAVPEEQKNVLRETPWGTMTYLQYKKHIEFGRDEYDMIDSYCKSKPLVWSASLWDLPSLAFIMEYDVPFLKIPSAMMTNDALLKATAKTGKPMIVSTGMSTIDEIDHAVELLERETCGNYILLHTNSSYPARNDELNLNMIPALAERYGCLVGYSGHETDLMPSVMAVALGACIVERHVTLDRTMWGTDQAASVSISGMQALRGRVDTAAAIMGSGKKVLTNAEMSIRKKLRGC